MCADFKQILNVWPIDCGPTRIPWQRSLRASAQPSKFYSPQCSGETLYFDFSKNRITPDTLTLLIDLANQCGLAERIDRADNHDGDQTSNNAVLDGSNASALTEKIAHNRSSGGIALLSSPSAFRSRW